MAADLSVTLLEEGAPRSDFAARREIKYVFTRRDVATLRQVLLRSCRPIQYAGPVSTVRSIYFDEPGLGTCRAIWTALESGTRLGCAGTTAGNRATRFSWRPNGGGIGSAENTVFD